MRKGLIMLAAAVASLSGGVLATPASAHYYHRDYHRGWSAHHDRALWRQHHSVALHREHFRARHDRHAFEQHHWAAERRQHYYATH